MRLFIGCILVLIGFADAQGTATSANQCLTSVAASVNRSVILIENSVRSTRMVFLNITNSELFIGIPSQITTRILSYANTIGSVDVTEVSMSDIGNSLRNIFTDINNGMEFLKAQNSMLTRHLNATLSNVKELIKLNISLARTCLISVNPSLASIFDNVINGIVNPALGLK